MRRNKRNQCSPVSVFNQFLQSTDSNIVDLHEYFVKYDKLVFICENMDIEYVVSIQKSKAFIFYC